MTIPDEARKRIQTLYVNITPGALRETLRECALEGAEIAARAAQVAILRELAEEFNGRAGGGYTNPLAGGLEEATWGWAEGRLLERANELEADA
jgi:hypothetical protein